MFFAHPQAKNTKFAKIELKICNKPQIKLEIGQILSQSQNPCVSIVKNHLLRGGEKTPPLGT